MKKLMIAACRLQCALFGVACVLAGLQMLSTDDGVPCIVIGVLLLSIVFKKGMKKLFRRLRCFLGNHEWVELWTPGPTTPFGGAVECKHCGHMDVQIMP